MARAVSFNINTDPTHGPDRGGFPGGTVSIVFYTDDDDYPPGQDGLKPLENMGSITLGVEDDIAKKHDGWYFLDARATVDKLPNRLRDSIYGFMNQSMACSRMNMIMNGIIADLPSERQREIVKVTTEICMKIVLEQPIATMMQIWPKDESAGYVLIREDDEYVAGRRFPTYADAEDAMKASGMMNLRIGLLTLYPGDMDPNGELKQYDFNDES